jgi:hypothetical protein
VPPVRLRTLLDRLPSDCQARVARTRDRLNKPIRDALRRETGLRLIRPSAEGEEESVSVPVRLRPGLPTALDNVELEEAEAIALILSRWREALEDLQGGARTAREMIASLQSDARFMTILTPGETLVSPVEAWAEALLRRIASANPLAKILIDRDVLGAYTFGAPGIDLYWAVIGLVAQTLGITIEDLTAVVLAHELAHAYTHMGADIDGYRWGTVAFGRAELELVEGLAQYYTCRVSSRLEGLCPGAINSYKALLQKQPTAYQVHVPWTEFFQSEEIRFAVIENRRRSVTRLDDLNALMGEARARLRPKQP